MNQSTFHLILSRLMDDVYDALTIKPQRKCIVPGLIAWDGCDCGALNGTISRWGVTDRPDNLTPPLAPKCAVDFQVATMNISLVRCVPGPGPKGTPPTCQALEDAALLLEQDAYWVLETVVCTLQELEDDDTSPLRVANWQIVQQNPVGPEGVCAGSVVQFNVWLAR